MILAFEGHQVTLGSEGNKEPEVFQGTKEEEVYRVWSEMSLTSTCTYSQSLATEPCVQGIALGD